MTLTVFFVVFLALLMLSMPVAWAMIAAVLAWIAVADRWTVLQLLPERIFQGIDVFVLMAIPLFILAGEIINDGGITRRLVHLANILFGWMRGGLAQVNVGASVLFSGITGVALGDIAALGRVFIPSMVAQGYTPAYAAAVTAASSIIGPMVPPSLIIVVYGSVTNTSIGGLFAAAVLPGLVIALCQMLLIAVQARMYDYGRIEADRTLIAVSRASLMAVLPLMVPVIIIAGILGGVMTPTEAGGVAAFYALVIAVLIYRSLTLRQLPALLGRATVFSGQLLIIVACGAAFSWIMGIENVPAVLERTIVDWRLGPAETLLIFNVFLLIVGMFIDPSAAIILFGPILAPAAINVGVDPLHFGAVLILNLNIGLLTPPLGVCLFAAEKVANCGLVPLMRAVAPFLVVNVIGLLIVTYVPAVSLWLPRLAGF